MNLSEMSLDELEAYKEVCICYGSIEDVAECIRLIRGREGKQ